MLWDDSELQLVELGSDKRGLAIALLTCQTMCETLAKAFDLAGLDVLIVNELAACLSSIPTTRPDLVVFEADALKCETDVFQHYVAAVRTTETLPTLQLSVPRRDRTQKLCVADDCTLSEAFLTLRAILRRSRPTALKGKRRCDPFLLDESRFKLFYNDTCAELSKADLCILGPFFDVRNAVFDRTTLEHLAFASQNFRPGNRTVDVHVSRARRHIRKQLGIDPIRSIRGVGYALAVS